MIDDEQEKSEKIEIEPEGDEIRQLRVARDIATSLRRVNKPNASVEARTIAYSSDSAGLLAISDRVSLYVFNMASEHCNTTAR